MFSVVSVCLFIGGSNVTITHDTLGRIVPVPLDLVPRYRDPSSPSPPPNKHVSKGENMHKQAQSTKAPHSLWQQFL